MNRNNKPTLFWANRIMKRHKQAKRTKHKQQTNLAENTYTNATLLWNITVLRLARRPEQTAKFCQRNYFLLISFVLQSHF